MILCYSGTGNSRYIAQRIADELQDNIIDLNEKIKYLKEAGFHSFACGIENGSDTALKRMNKSANLAANKKALDILKKYGIYVQAGYILFDDNTTFEELKENYDFLREYDWIITKGISDLIPIISSSYCTNDRIRRNPRYRIKYYHGIYRRNPFT